jgi:hypothetical protein
LTSPQSVFGKKVSDRTVRKRRNGSRIGV